MNQIADLAADIRTMRPFLPAKDYEASLRFYVALGFHAYSLGDALSELSLGPHAFLLQGYYVKQWADNMMMHVLLTDVHRWWHHIASLDLADRFGVPPPKAPTAESWGLTVAYVVDPSGVLWHFAQPTQPDQSPANAVASS
jgi:catechol 2,3-dioxygenase-like lactoylglutathione lyase family enzyme